MSERGVVVLECILRRKPITLPVALLAAHPDDETIGAGASLHLFKKLILVHATDGSPPDMVDARRAGFDSAAEYANCRRRELEAALGRGAPGAIRTALHFVDQCVSLHMEDLTRCLAEKLGRLRIAVLITHPYEGGHPDHDACAFAARSAVRIMARFGTAPDLIEMSCYHAGPNGAWVVGNFIPADCPPAVKYLSADEQNCKTDMLRCFRSQSSTLAWFYLDQEAFRRAPDYDFQIPPHAGSLNYEQYPWGMSGSSWRELARRAAISLGAT